MMALNSWPASIAAAPRLADPFVVDDYDLSAVGRRVREARVAKGLTQDELSDLTHTQALTVSRIELGKQEPKAETIAAFAKALGVSSDWLLFGATALDDTADESRVPPYPAWADFLAHAWTASLPEPMRGDVLRELRGISFHKGAPSVDDYISLAQPRVAKWKGKAVPDSPVIPAPHDEPGSPRLPPPRRRK